ncbi:heparinase II/III domain-containing protein [Bacillus shihchuchen]|uniref:Heparinase II/III family protein n=2 Tax=Bacillus cereus group TaxID=86661 RepID=A0ABT7KR80_9BACI|nr:heparinase II/III family protein [Bacillus shihchuchen]
MMDRALIMLGIILDHPESNRWIEKGILRLKDTFYYSYSQQGVHLENSPEYHRIVRNLYKSIENFLNKNDLTLGEDVVTRMEMSDEYFNYIVKPNGLTPAIGDSGLLPIGAQNKIYDSFHDQVAGITVMQSKNEGNPEKSTWLSFVCGYGTTTHKHYDDLSVNIFYKGHDILVDPGKYSYGRSPVRSYVISPQAHNTIAFPNERYVFDKSQGVNRKIKTTSFVSTNKMDMVQGINGGYKDTLFKRTVIFLKPNLVIFLDEIISENSVKVSQYFNLAPHIEIKEVMYSKIQIISDNEIIEFEQINDVDSVNIHKGQANPPKAIISEQFGKTTEINQLEFSKNVNSDYFLTVIKLGKEAIDSFNFARFDKVNRLISIEMSNQNIQFYV